MGLAGVAWNAKILPVKVLDADGLGSNATIAKGIKFAAERGAQVINISLGGPGFSQTEVAAFNAVINTYGAVVVAAASSSPNRRSRKPLPPPRTLRASSSN